MADENDENAPTDPALSLLPSDTTSKLYAVVRFPEDKPETVETVCQAWITGTKDKQGRTKCYFPTGHNYAKAGKKLNPKAYNFLLGNFCMPPNTNGWEFEVFPCWIEGDHLARNLANKKADELRKSGKVHHKGKVESDLDKSEGPELKRPRTAGAGGGGKYEETASSDSGEESSQLPNPPAAVCLNFIIHFLFQQFFQKICLLIQFHTDFFRFFFLFISILVQFNAAFSISFYFSLLFVAFIRR